MRGSDVRHRRSVENQYWEKGSLALCGQFSASSAIKVLTYFSRATTNSGAHNNARLNSESGKVQIAFRADSA